MDTLYGTYTFIICIHSISNATHTSQVCTKNLCSNHEWINNIFHTNITSKRFQIKYLFFCSKELNLFIFLIFSMPKDHLKLNQPIKRHIDNILPQNPFKQNIVHQKIDETLHKELTMPLW